MFFTLWSNWSSVGVLRLNSQQKKSCSTQQTGDLYIKTKKEEKKRKCAQLTEAVGKKTKREKRQKCDVM